MKRLFFTLLFAVMILSTSSYAYTYNNDALYCTSCSDCTDAINNVTYNTTYLNTSILVSSDCINNPANFTNVTFDCQGYTIDGNIVGIYGIILTGKTDNIIRNCHVVNFGNGMYVNISSNNTIINNTFASNLGYGMQLRTSPNNNIVNNNVNSNWRGIGLVSSPDNIITGNTMSNNTRSGSYLQGSTGNNITNNTLTLNSYGMYIAYSSHNNNITNNTLTLNGDGIYLSSSNNNDVIYNNIYTNSGYGIRVLSSSNGVLTNNMIIRNNGDISETGSAGNTYINNTIYSNKNSSAISYLTNKYTNVSTEIGFNMSIQKPGGSAQTIKKINSIENFPTSFAFSYDNTTTNIFGNVTPTKLGLYSIKLNLTDSDDNEIYYFQNLYSVSTSENFSTTVNYYIRPGIEPSHGQPAGTDARSLLFSEPTQNKEFSCGVWIQMSPDITPMFVNGIIDNVTMNYWYYATGLPIAGIQRTVTYDSISDIYQSIPSSADYILRTTNFTNINWAMDSESDWYNLAFKVNGTGPSILSGPNQLSYVTIDYITNTPALSMTNSHDLTYLSSLFNSSYLKDAEMIIDGEGTKTLEIKMPEMGTYDVYMDSVLCDSLNPDCSFTQSGQYINITLNLGSEHTINIVDYPPVRSNGQPTGTIYDSSVTLSLDTDEPATCRYSTTPGISYDSMPASTTTTLDTTHSWTVSASIGTNNYYVRCSDQYENKNTDDYLITFKRLIQVGPIQGPIIGPIGIIIDDPSSTDETTPADDVIGTQFAPDAGGTCILLDSGVCLNVFGTSATLHSVSDIDPNNYKILLCNQSYVYAYEINITVEDAYLCFDTTKADLAGISIYTFDGDWVELDEIVHKDNKVCGKIKSSPYMIAGFKTSPTQQAALNAINLADSRIKSAVVDTTEAEALLEQARQAYFNCKYEDAYNLAQEALRKLPIILPEVSIWVWVIVGALLMSGYYIYKHPKYLKFKKKKSK